MLKPLNRKSLITTPYQKELYICIFVSSCDEKRRVTQCDTSVILTTVRNKFE